MPPSVMPQCVTFNLDVGMTGDEQLGYELGSLGMPLDRAERRSCNAAARDSCAVCCAARRRAAEEQLYVGAREAWLAPRAGQVRGLPACWATSSSDVLARRDPLQAGAVAHVVPAMPAMDWTGEPGACGAWPDELSRPAPDGVEGAPRSLTAHEGVPATRTHPAKSRRKRSRMTRCWTHSRLQDCRSLRSQKAQPSSRVAGRSSSSTSPSSLRVLAVAMIGAPKAIPKASKSI